MLVDQALKIFQLECDLAQAAKRYVTCVDPPETVVDISFRNLLVPEMRGSLRISMEILASEVRSLTLLAMTMREVATDY